MKEAGWQSDDGFTLIELVIAMLLLGLIALAVESGLHFGTRVWERSQQSAKSANMIDMGQTILREILSQAIPRFKGEYITFSGEPSTLEFDCIPPQAFAENGTTHASLSITEETEEDDVILKVNSIINPAAVRKATLIRGVNGLRFSYLDASGKIPVWLSYWRDRNRLPDAIRIATDDQSSSRWPTLIIRPFLSQGSNCVLDPVSMKCREIH
jgi:prepilin-type N-terminal cleavage/methylation domain-containing protein